MTNPFDNGPVIPLEWSSADSSQVDPVSARERLQKYRPTTKKKVWAWVSVVLGGFMLVSALFSPTSYAEGSTVGSVVGGIAVSLGILLPGAYWHYRNRTDQRTIAEWQRSRTSHEELRRVLRGAELELLGRQSEVPMLSKRRWEIVIVCSLALWMAGGLMLPGAAA
ncbi:hypothetical protein [Corynebacterium doosanense]|uniref:Membrane protein n=1 Tax=Corynebacterium doosanense CAU 212 = DSM 45436 TaxID=558173 RepID=A0A097IHG4_9CORY|nr:hypothetical protein [Corynebacterium doosanense]AIT61553.1 membrane protein [Corynebacterium doosanense CAU 212 = DSM 45436]